MGAFIDQRLPEDEVRKPIIKSPPIVILFILVFVVVHIITEFLSDADYNRVLENFALMPAQLLMPADLLPPTVWMEPKLTLLSYAFLHADFTHLTFNMLWFLIFGTVVARRVGNAGFVGLMFVTTLGAAFAHLAFYWGSTLPVVGVSGAVSGMMGAAFRFILPNPNAVATWPPPPLPLFSRTVLFASAVWLVLNFLLGVSGLTLQGFGAPIAWEAHMGGYLTGLILFPLFDARRRWLR